MISSRCPFIDTTTYYPDSFYKTSSDFETTISTDTIGASLATIAQYPLIHNHVNNRPHTSSGRNNYTPICINEELKKNHAYC